MPVYSAWPREAYEPYQEIKRCQEDIRNMSRYCIEEGRRHKEVIEALTPLIKARSTEISDYANEIIDMLPERSAGRLPKWFKIAEQVEEMASNIALIVDEDLRPALKKHQAAIIFDALEGIRLQNQEILTSLKQIPRPVKPSKNSKGSQSVIEVWDEADEVAEKAFRKVAR